MDKIQFYILIRSWKTYKYFDRCINSVLSQNYKNFKIIFIDDASNYSIKTKNYINSKLKKHIVVFNKTRKYSLRNSYYAIYKFCINENAVVFNLDGDDWLPHPNCLSEVAKIYKKFPDTKFTYGDCLIWNGTIVSQITASRLMKNVNIFYSRDVWHNKSFRQEPFLPLHPRTWKVSIFKLIQKKEFLDSNGKWLRFAEDMAIFFPMLEKVSSDEIRISNKPLYVYNKTNPHADIAENTVPLLRDEIEIRKKRDPRTKTLVAPPIGSRPSTVSIGYGRLPSVPILGKILNIIEVVLLRNKLLTQIFISLKDKQTNNTVTNLLRSYKTVVIKSAKIHPVVKYIESFKVFHQPNANLYNMQINELYDLMWTLTYCDAITLQTKNSLARILPSNYPVIRI